MLDYVYINNEFINNMSYIKPIVVNFDGKIYDKNNGIIYENYLLKKEDLSNENRDDISSILLNIINQENKINISKLDKWLDNKKPNIILDGANIGYSNKQNKSNKISFKKIEIVRDYYSKFGKNVVIFLHKRHFNKKLNDNDNEIIDNWNKLNCIYKTPYNMNDDLFWIYSTIKINCCFFVTNDKIRDHYFEMIHKNNVKSKQISPFIYWYNDYNISYNFKNNKFIPNPVSNYSVKIQLNKYNNTNYCCFPTINNDWFMILYD